MPYADQRVHENNARLAPASSGGPNRTGTFDAASLTAEIAGRVLGQDSAIAAVGHALVVAQAGLHDRERPLASLLLVGPTGVGKTELVRQLAAGLRTGPDDLCRVDMGQLAQEHYAASLAGAPPGYAGSKESLSIFDRPRIEGTPLMPGIVLFDEVEKAHPIVLRALLGLLDRGQLTLANGEQTISFRNTFVFLTSNLGSADVARRRSARWRRIAEATAARLPGGGSAWPGLGSTARDAAAVDRAIHSFFDPEFLNRLDGVVHFESIPLQVAADIVRLRLDDAHRRLARRGVTMRVEDGVVQALVQVGFDSVYGARNLSRAVRRHVLVPVAEAMVSHRSSGADVAQVRIEPGVLQHGPLLRVEVEA